MARVLIEEGADIEAHASADSGGVPGGSALLHAVVFGMTDVVDVLVAAGAEIHGIEEAAATGDVSRWLGDAHDDARVRALVMAADHERLDVMEALIAAGGGRRDRRGVRRPPAPDGRRERAPASVRRLLAHGADPELSDEQGRTPLELCRQRRCRRRTPERDEVESILAGLGGSARPGRLEELDRIAGRVVETNLSTAGP